jgi:CheY-like chemotaxis protein
MRKVDANRLDRIVGDPQAANPAGQSPVTPDHPTDLDSIRRMAGEIAHDLNNLLAVVLGYSQLAAGTSGLPPSLRASLFEIEKAAASGEQLIARLQQLGRSESVDSRMVPTPTTTPGKPGVTKKEVRKTRHILYLDDDAPVVALVCRGLQDLGHRVSGFVSAREALAAVNADAGDFDLVVTDFSMPLVSGLDVARQIAKLKSDLRVVLVSGAISDELLETCQRLEICEVLEKSVSIRELCSAIDARATALDRR